MQGQNNSLVHTHPYQFDIIINSCYYCKTKMKSGKNLSDMEQKF